MLKIKLLCVGDKMPAWVNQGASDYIQRVRDNTQIELIEIAAQKRGKNADLSRILASEGQALLKQVSPGSRLICLDRLGKSYNSVAISRKISQWQQDGETINFAIGGPEGIDGEVLARANEKWSMSDMTFSHHVARVMLAEQLYRAWSITQGMPYHR